MSQSQTPFNQSGEKSTHRIKEEIYNTFQINKKDLPLYQATSERFKERQAERLNTPLFQKTNIVNLKEQQFRPQILKTQYSDQHSQIFDVFNFKYQQNLEPRALRDIQLKPSFQKMKEPGQNSELVFKRQLKTTEFSNKQNNMPNPITYGDPKSEYVKNLKVKRENMPKDQFSFQ